MEIVEFRPDMVEATADLLSRAFSENPLHIAAFGKISILEKNRAFFRNGLGLFRGRRLVATEGSRIIGFIHWVKSPGCQFSFAERIGLLPVMLYELGPGAALRVSSWLSAWAKRDVKETHLHLGPVAVDRDFQGKGVGSRLMQIYCAELDGIGESGYLETDKSQNVEFYRKFGFEVVSESQVIGVQTYFMTRR